MNLISNSGESHGGFTYFFSKKILIFRLTVVIVVLIALFVFEGCRITAYADTTAIVVRNTIYHTHTGGSGSGGGCYSVSCTGTRTITVPCGGTLYYWGDSWGTSECTNCGASYFGNRSGEGCPHSSSATETYTYYTLGCGRTPDTVLGYVTYTVDTTEWAREVHVTVSIEDSGLGLSANPYVMNGTEYGSGEFTLTENGTYTFGVSADSNSNTGPAEYTITVNNIDHTPPTINSYSLLPTEWVREGVTLNLADVTDPQPDGTSGCGLNQHPFSYDGGITWEDEPTHFYENNGDYYVLVRDALDNVQRLNFTIDNIDNESPNIISIEYDHTRNVRDLTIEVFCDDVLADGRDGCGLDDLPYSYDGGETWTASNALYVNHNTVIDFRVRDKLGNENSASVSITNIDDYKPLVSHVLYPGFWTNGDVEVSFSAFDRNPDGNEGIGLPDDCFSYDSGITWTSENVVVMTENGNVNVAVRDKNHNINYYSLEIINIDRIAPHIYATVTVSEDRRMAVLAADGTDGESGIDYGGFIWTGPDGSASGAQITALTNGQYTVTGRDKAGNAATATVSVDGLLDNSVHPILDSGDDGNGGGADYSLSDNGNGSDTIKNITVDKLFKRNETVNNEPMTGPEDIDMRPWYKKLWDEIKDWWENLTDFEKFMIAVTVILIFAGIIFLVFLYVRSTKVYDQFSEGRYKLTGVLHISYSNGMYKIKVPESLIDRAESTSFRFKLKWLFVLLHRRRDLHFILPDGRMDTAEILRFADIDVR